MRRLRSQLPPPPVLLLCPMLPCHLVSFDSLGLREDDHRQQTIRAAGQHGSYGPRYGHQGLVPCHDQPLLLVQVHELDLLLGVQAPLLIHPRQELVLVDGVDLRCSSRPPCSARKHNTLHSTCSTVGPRGDAQAGMTAHLYRHHHCVACSLDSSHCRTS